MTIDDYYDNLLSYIASYEKFVSSVKSIDTSKFGKVHCYKYHWAKIIRDG